MKRRTLLQSIKRPVTLIAIGLVASLSLSAQANPPSHGFRGGHYDGLSNYGKHAYSRRHQSVRGIHGYDRSYDRQGNVHGLSIFPRGSHSGFQFNAGHTSYDVAYSRGNRSHSRRGYH